jgi:cyclic-di-GMP-binding protein
MPSFDVVSNVDMSELDNALNQANRELAQRFDFKGTDAKIERGTAELVVSAATDDRVRAALEVLKEKLVRRKVSLRFFEFGEMQKAAKGSAKLSAKIKEGIDPDNARKIVKLIKDAKLKVQAAIQDKAVRVSGKKRDDLQDAIKLIRGSSELNIELQFINFRD